MVDFENKETEEAEQEQNNKDIDTEPFVLETSKYGTLSSYKATPREFIIFRTPKEVASEELLSLKPDESGDTLSAATADKTCREKHEASSTKEYLEAQKHENDEAIAFQINNIENMAPFKLKRVYGRSDDVPVINLTGICRNHIVYASSNVVVFFDYVENVQKCLQGHKNRISHLNIEQKGRFMVSTAVGQNSHSLIIVWATVTGEPLKYVSNPKGSIFACFTGVDYVLASIGAEGLGKQTINFWNFDPKDNVQTPLVSKTLPSKTSIIREVTFLEKRPELFAATGDRNVIFGSWVRDHNGDSIQMDKPRLRKTFISKYKRFTSSLWMKNGEWLATATGAGFVVIWGLPMPLDDILERNRNIRDFTRSFKLCEEAITVFTMYKDYIVIGDEIGIVRFFDHDFKLLRWSRNFNLPAIHSISLNSSPKLTDFKAKLRENFHNGSGDAPNYLQNSRVKDYTKGGFNFRQVSKTTLSKPKMPCPDFIFATYGGDVYYYHFNEMQLDKLVAGTPGPFIAVDACPGVNHVAYATARGDIQMFDYATHDLVFSDRIFAPGSRVTTMKFHPFGQVCAFGLYDGRISFRWNYTWKTAMPPVSLTPDPVVRIIFSDDGLHLAYFDANHVVAVMKYLPKGHGWMILGKSQAHFMPIVDISFLNEPGETCKRLFSVSLDRHLIEYDIDRSTEDMGLFIVKITSLEQTARPTAMVFEGPPEWGIDCITFSNNINKVRLFCLEDEKVKKTCCGPVFGRDPGIKRMVNFPVQMSAERLKTFIVYVVKNKLGIMDTPINGNPNKYMAVQSHPQEILEIIVVPEKERIFTIGKEDNVAFVWEASPKAVEASVLMSGNKIDPIYQTLKRNWGGACQNLDLDLNIIFFYLNLKRIDKQTDFYKMHRSIRICEMSVVCRACGFFPSEYEIALMTDEARRLKIADQSYTDDFITELMFDEFLELFVNHFYRTIDEDVEEAFQVLGFGGESENDEGSFMCKQDFVKYLTEEGEKISYHNFPIFFEPMYDVRLPREFGFVKCHTVDKEESFLSSSSSSTLSSDHVRKNAKSVAKLDIISNSSGSSSSDVADEDEDDDENEDDEDNTELQNDSSELQNVSSELQNDSSELQNDSSELQNDEDNEVEEEEEEEEEGEDNEEKNNKRKSSRKRQSKRKSKKKSVKNKPSNEKMLDEEEETEEEENESVEEIEDIEDDEGNQEMDVEEIEEEEEEKEKEETGENEDLENEGTGSKEFITETKRKSNKIQKHPKPEDGQEEQEKLKDEISLEDETEIETENKENNEAPKEKICSTDTKEDETLVDLPERIDLMYFLDKMLPPDSQQTIRWRTKKDKEVNVNECKASAENEEQNSDYIKLLSKQVVDPNTPLKRSLLKTLYAEFYLEHGDFTVPIDIYLGGLKENESEFTAMNASQQLKNDIPDMDEEEEEDGEEGDEDEEDENNEEEDDDQDNNNWDLDAMLVDNYNYPEPRFNENESAAASSDEDKDSSSSESKLDTSAAPKNVERESGPTTATTNTSLVPQSSDVEDTVDTPPFTATEMPTTHQLQQQGDETDATEDMTDLENVYEQEDIDFVKSMNPKNKSA